jgi:phosphate butyryltransferase
MQPIKSLDELVEHVKSTGRKKRIAVAYAQDPNTIGAIGKAVKAGFIEALMVGDKSAIEKEAGKQGVSAEELNIIHVPGETASTKEALRLVREDEADVLMKGLVGTNKFLKAVLDKEKGLLPEKSVMSYVCAIELPKYHKLLFVTDTAVLPFPDINQKIAMVDYSVTMAKKFGIERPKVALISASEKVSHGFPNTIDYAEICKRVDRGQIQDCIIDGPLDIFLACDKESVEIKGVDTPINGDADVLVLPTLEASNSFYKGLMLFGGGELGGLIQGTTKPVVVMSRSESPASKFYCVALSCLMAEENQ